MRQTIEGILWIATGLLLFGGFIVSILVLCGQALYWLKYGQWPALTGRDVLGALDLPTTFSTSWRGVNTILDGILDLPAAAFCAMAGVFSGSVTGWILIKSEEDARLSRK